MLPALSWALLLACALPSAASAQSSILPEWLGRETEAWAGRREPQIRNQGPLFRDARAVEAGSLDDAVLLCRVHASEPDNGRWDTFADPDLRIVVSVSGRRSVIWGPENSRGHTFSIPAVRLRRGQRLVMAVSDRDVTADEHIGRIEAVYAGRMPMALAARYLEGECRLVDPALVTTRLAASLAAAEPHVVAVESAAPALDQPGLGRPDVAGRAATRRLLEAAAYASWRGAGVRALRQRLEQGERSFQTRLRRSIADARRAAPARGEPSIVERGGTVRVRTFACGARARAMAPVPERDAPGRCVLHLDVTSARDEVPVWLVPADVIDANGGLHAPSSTGFVERIDETSVRVALVLASDVRSRGALLRVADRRALLRLD